MIEAAPAPVSAVRTIGRRDRLVGRPTGCSMKLAKSLRYRQKDPTHADSQVKQEMEGNERLADLRHDGLLLGLRS